jgi:hypothetical protein
MPSTDRGMPIPLDSDPLSDVAKWIRDLAASLPGGARRGAVTATTDASGDLTVTHGLGTTPTCVQATVLNNNGSNWTIHAHTIGATTFKLRFRIANTAAVQASTAGVAASWLALA